MRHELERVHAIVDTLVRRALTEVGCPAKVFEAMRVAIVEGMTIEEMADSLDVSPKRVRAILDDNLEAIAKLIGAIESDEARDYHKRQEDKWQRAVNSGKRA